MKRLAFTSLYLLVIGWCFAQADITAAEYFIDEDPGEGLGTSFPVTITQGQSIDVSFTIPTSSMGLSEGFHLLGIRIQDENGDWSMYEMRGFIIQTNVGLPSPSPADIDLLEYFIDEDPGVGSGISITGAGATVNVNEIISSSGISDGFHAIGVRARNTDSRWGFTDLRAFYIQDIDELTSSDPLEITELEYFIDEDPGHGNGQSISVIQNLVIDVDELISVTEVTPGFHTISVRAKDENNQWGFTETRVFYVQNIDNTPDEISPIVAMEYFIDEDPGYGQGIPISTSAGNVVDITSIQLSLVDSYPIGDHIITIRAQNEEGKWGFGETREFTIDGNCPVAGFEVAKACVGEDMMLTNASTAVLGEADYMWYADGVLISTEEDDVLHAFNSPGNHTLSLAIANGLLCTDSTGVVIEVKPKPIVVFNAESVTVGEVSQFVVDTFNLDQSSSWEWDFESDGIVDDTTPGNTSFQYGSDGTYTANVTVTDEEGCGTSFSRNITVQPSEVPVTPIVLFEVSGSCTGLETTFTDQSSNVPVGSTYAWDFDGDGAIDATDVGNTSHTYTEAGLYEAELTINTPENVSVSSSVEVVIQNQPVVDFDFTYETDGVESATASFINLSEGNSLDFSWDFGGLGSSSAISPTFIFENYEGGTYSICLKGSNQCDEVSICKDITFTSVNNNPPSAIFETDAGCVGIEATFEDLSTNIPAGSTYSWDFDGDGIADASDAGDVTYTFTEAGIYEAELIITTSDNVQVSASEEIVIQDVPVVEFEFSYETDGTESATVSFINLSEGNGVDFLWDFNGLGNSESINPTFTFENYEGETYSICLIGSNQCDEVSICKDITFTSVNNNPPSAIFDTDAGCVGIEAIFEDLSTNIPAGSTYSWDFDGDGIADASDAGDVTYSFTEAGIYEAELIITTPDNVQVSASEEIVIQEAPSVGFNFTYDTDLDKSATVNFINLSEGSSVDYLWDFDGEGTSTSVSPTFTFDDFVGKTYTVCLTATNQCPKVITCQDVSFEVTGISSFESRGIKLYPNPSHGNTSINLAGLESGDYLIQIIDVSGKVHHMMNISYSKDGSINFPTLDKGIYLVTIKSEAFWAREKLIVK